MTKSPKRHSSRGAELSPESITQRELSAFRHELLEWYDRHGRELPWRGTTDPYKIWVSEIILQQTQTAQGWDYYLRFIDRLPDVRSLAEVSEDQLMLLWQGLGYYSRAHNMQHAARQIMEQHGGVFPRTEREVAALKGVGPYTTAAIMSIAYDYPLAVVDGNVYRVLSRYLASETPIDSTAGQRYYREMAQLFLDRESPGQYNQAMMDLGATVCTPKAPLCDTCPVASGCRARGTALLDLLPIKSHKTRVQERWIDYFLLRHEGTIAIRRRDTRRGVWKGLYEFPSIVSERKPSTPPDPPKGWTILETMPLKDHRLSHRLLHIRVHVCAPLDERIAKDPDGVERISFSDHPSIAFPKPLREYLDRLSTAPPGLFDD